MGAKIIQIVDTNVIVRFLVADNMRQKEQAALWFKQAEQGKRKLILHPLVIAETCFVLESFYKLTKQAIADALEVFVSQKWFIVEEKDVLLSLFDLYRRGNHFVDSFLVAWSQVHSGNILSFDKKLVKK